MAGKIASSEESIFGDQEVIDHIDPSKYSVEHGPPE
jgi:hypothetical protein